ncbi:MAG: hypothetical protein GXP24_12445 [Planctomycetes bacterium]|nr:hypothetical protein [Planctomycetota bacterium]
MSQPVKISDSLILDARQTSKVAERSIAGQIEYWARLGRAVEPLISGEKALALRQTGDLKPLFELLASVDTAEGRSRVAEVLAEQPFPHYESAPNQPGLLVRTEADGQQAIGKFVGRKFNIFEPTACDRATSNKKAAEG